MSSLMALPAQIRFPLRTSEMCLARFSGAARRALQRTRIGRQVLWGARRPHSWRTSLGSSLKVAEITSDLAHQSVRGSVVA